MALGCQTLYRGDMRKTMLPNALLREDTPIACNGHRMLSFQSINGRATLPLAKSVY